MNYYIQGDAANADKIKAAFEEIVPNNGYDFKYSDVLFFTYDCDGRKYIMSTKIGTGLDNIILTHPDYTELELPVEPKFKVGDWLYHNTCGVHPILVKDYSETQGYKVECISSTYYIQKGVVEKEYHLWTIQDAKDGDVLVSPDGSIIIYAGKIADNGLLYDYVALNKYKILRPHEQISVSWLVQESVKPATKEQRDLLFAKMKEEGYQWDAEKKELHKTIKPKFKVGDDIETGNTIDTIAEIGYATYSYYCESGRTIWFENQDLWHLVPKKHYDIANFHAGMPVLVRDSEEFKWLYTIFGIYNKDNLVYPFVVVNMRGYAQCIPFEGNEHLLGTTDMPSEEYINW